MRYYAIFGSFVIYSIAVWFALSTYVAAQGLSSVDTFSDIVFGYAAMVMASIFFSAYIEKSHRRELFYLACGAMVLAAGRVIHIFLQQESAATNGADLLESGWALAALVTLCGDYLIVRALWEAGK